MYTTFDNAVRYSPVGREAISYVLVKVKPGFEVSRVQSAIDGLGDVQALTRDQFRGRSLRFVLVETGIGFNFGITIALGFFVGLALSAAIFYQFTLENLKHFAVLKAMGARAWILILMVLTQALVVGLVGYGIGVGIAGLFTIMTRRAESQLETIMPWQLMVISFGATVLTIMLGSLLSIRRVLSVSPGRVFSQ
jgi:putative ABC transport system permease protein